MFVRYFIDVIAKAKIIRIAIIILELNTTSSIKPCIYFYYHQKNILLKVITTNLIKDNI